MAQAHILNPEGPRKRGPVLVPLPGTRVTPKMVSQARRGAELMLILSHAKKELEPIKALFDEHFTKTKTREATDAKGRVIAIRTHSENIRLDQAAIKLAHPKIVAEFTYPQPWDSVDFPR